MLERALLLAGLLVVVMAAALLIRAVRLARASASHGRVAPAALRSRLTPTAPTVLYFYGPGCTACADQAADLRQLEREGARVVAVDAVRDREIADWLGVFTVPTTAVLDASGRVHHVNPGYHPKHALARQLAAVGG